MLLCIWLLEDLGQHQVHEVQEYECELARTLDAMRMRERIG